jgi:hypothetical protein
MLQFGRGTSAWMAGSNYSLRDVESETTQNAFAIGFGLLGVAGRIPQAAGELRNLAALHREFDSAMQIHTRAVQGEFSALAKFARYQAAREAVLAGRPASEIPGIELALERMRSRPGWELMTERLEYGAGRGTDLWWRGVGEKGGLFLHVEAKPATATASRLKLLETSRSIGKYRQGGEAHIGYALQTIVETGAPNAAVARDLLIQLRMGNVRTVASLKGGLFRVDYFGGLAGLF